MLHILADWTQSN